MKRVYPPAGLLALALLCAGCWPARITSSPAARGVVLDFHTQKPVGGAKVQMSYSWNVVWNLNNPPPLAEVLSNARPPLIITGTNGEFSIPRKHRWVIMYPTPAWFTPGMLVIQRDGYKTEMFPSDDINNEDLQPGKFYLTPLPK
jgi:hypothetical protein